MSVDSWLDDVYGTELLSPALTEEVGKETKPDVQESVRPRKRRLLSPSMDEDLDNTPRPSKKRNVGGAVVSPTPSSQSSRSGLSLNSQLSYSQESGNDSYVSHKSGRVSPTKQVLVLEDLREPVKFHPFNSSRMDMPDDVKTMRLAVQALADGVGFLPTTKDELSRVLQETSGINLEMDLPRFQHPWILCDQEQDRHGRLVPLDSMGRIVEVASELEDTGGHENVWNSEVHRPMLKAALESSRHAQVLCLGEVMTASIDPRWLLAGPLPARVVDYAIMLKRDAQLEQSFSALNPLARAGVKSWNLTTARAVRETPLAVSIETKAPSKSWTDGLPQLGIWSLAQWKRLKLLRTNATTLNDESQRGLPKTINMPSQPLLIAQGHEWHMLFVSERSSGGLTVWSQISLGSTRSVFDAYKVIAALQYACNWAATVWQPWFMELVKAGVGTGDQD